MANSYNRGSRMISEEDHPLQFDTEASSRTSNQHSTANTRSRDMQSGKLAVGSTVGRRPLEGY